MIYNEFEDAYQKAKSLHDSGKYKEALGHSLEAVDIATDILIMALRKRMWIARQVGYKDPKVRDEAYEIALICAKKILEISEDAEARNSAIKLLILLPGIDVEPLCNMGIKELESSNLDYQEKENLKAELMNSLGIEIRKTDPAEAMHIFIKAYEIVSKGTILAGHLLHNAGTSWLIMANAEKENLKKWSYLTHALDNLEKALKEYPTDQIGHRKAVEGKLKDTENKIKELEIK